MKIRKRKPVTIPVNHDRPVTEPDFWANRDRFHADLRTKKVKVKGVVNGDGNRTGPRVADAAADAGADAARAVGPTPVGAADAAER